MALYIIGRTEKDSKGIESKHPKKEERERVDLKQRVDASFQSLNFKEYMAVIKIKCP